MYKPLLTALIGACLALPAHAQTQDAGDYEVALSPRLILPPTEPVERGERRVFSPGETIFRTQLGWLFHSKLAAPIEFEISGLPVEISDQESLRRALNFEGGDLARFAEDAPVYCQREKTDAFKDILSGLTLGLTNFANRIARYTQTCLVDSDSDGDFDHAFLVGLKREEDRIAVEIPEIGYTEFTAEEQFAADEGDYIQVTYNERGGLFGHHIKMEVFIGGQNTGASGIYWWLPSMDERLYTPQEQKIDKNDHPQFMNWANALMNIVDYDKDTKEMTVEYVRDFTYSPLTVVITTYY